MTGAGFVPSVWEPEPLTSKNPGPANQMQATMQVEPSQGNIAEVVAFTGASSEEARRYLKVKRNDVNAAVNALLDREDISKAEQAETWDETAWNADREGNAEQHLVPLGHSNAPTRGPSPTPSLGIKAPGSQADEENELQRAILLSQGASAAPTSFQETGIRMQDGQERSTFGPATKAYYDEQQWGLTIAQEVVPDVPARDMKHVDSEPRFLKHLPSGDYLPNLLNICNDIPRARAALLMSDFAKDDYGYDADWWRGHSISMPRIVHTIDGTSADPDADKHDEFVTEVQRLVAVLGSSQRRYATIGALTQTALIRDVDLSSRTGNLLELFLEKWSDAACSKVSDPTEKAQISNIFTTIVGTTAPEGMQTPNLTVIDMCFGKTAEGQTIDLTEMLDNLLWDTADESTMADNYIERPAEILVMKLRQANPSITDLGVVVPSTICLDKYLKENVAASRETRQKMARGRRRVERLEEIEEKLKHWRHPTNGKRIEASQLWKHTIGHFSGQNRRDTDNADTTNTASLDQPQEPEYGDILAKLEATMASVEEKLKVLAEEREKTRKAISDMSKAPPPGLEEGARKHQYMLRGISTKPNITYILRRRDPAEPSPQSEEDTISEGLEWWRIHYEVNGQTARITTSRMADYDVLRAAELEHNGALLVYASDEANEWDDNLDDLPDGLKRFVEQDNARLHEELAAAEADVEPPAYNLTDYDVPRKSIERQDSMDSMKNMGGYSPNYGSQLPDYMDEDNARQHHAYGLGYDVKATRPDDDEPVHEIHLTPHEPDDLLSGISASTREVEMVETAHAPLIPRAANGSDVVMGDVDSQDSGVGGASHLEDTQMK